VAVFAASNFPFAFSVAGGDTAAALAAGCPVVVKTHPGHRRLSACCGELVTRALDEAGAPPGVFALVDGDEAGRRLVTHPDVTAVAFTGSSRVGRMLFDLAAGRVKPIPFYGELGSVNPVFVTPGAAASRLDEILSGYVSSFSLGAGQFCTQPGILLLPAGCLDRDRLRSLVGAQLPAKLLTDRIDAAFQEGLEVLRTRPSVEVIAEGTRQADGMTTPTLLRTTAENLVADAEHLLAECFGPVSLVAEYENEGELMDVAVAIEGQLTSTVHGESEEDLVPMLIDTLAGKSGTTGRLGCQSHGRCSTAAHTRRRPRRCTRRSERPPLAASSGPSPIRTCPTTSCRQACGLTIPFASRGASTANSGWLLPRSEATRLRVSWRRFRRRDRPVLGGEIAGPALGEEEAEQ